MSMVFHNVKNIDEIFLPPHTKRKAKGGVFMELNKNLYIEPRKGRHHRKSIGDKNIRSKAECGKK